AWIKLSGSRMRGTWTPHAEIPAMGYPTADSAMHHMDVRPCGESHAVQSRQCGYQIGRIWRSRFGEWVGPRFTWSTQTVKQLDIIKAHNHRGIPLCLRCSSALPVMASSSLRSAW